MFLRIPRREPEIVVLELSTINASSKLWVLLDAGGKNTTNNNYYYILFIFSLIKIILHNMTNLFVQSILLNWYNLLDQSPICSFSLCFYLLPGSVLTVNSKTENHFLNTRIGFNESLKCAVQNHTKEEKLLWYRDDGEVDLKSENRINSSSVCVSSITEDDNGVTFTCKLQSNQSRSISVVLNVTCE